MTELHFPDEKTEVPIGQMYRLSPPGSEWPCWALNTLSVTPEPVLCVTVAPFFPGFALLSEPPARSCCDSGAARGFRLGTERFWSLACGLVSEATGWFSGSQLLHLEYGDDITTFHYYVGVQLGLWAFEAEIGSDRLEGVRGSLDMQRS